MPNRSFVIRFLFRDRSRAYSFAFLAYTHIYCEQYHDIFDNVLLFYEIN